MKSTNYFEAFIRVAEDCRAAMGEAPPERALKSVARMQYEMLAQHPYEYTSDDVIFEVHALRKGVAAEDRAAEREAFLGKGQACLRASPLVKRYGWGLHHDAEGRVAMVGVETEEYRRLANDEGLEQLKGVRSRRGS